jgi:transposase
MGAIRMGKPYSDDLRERAVEALETGHTRVEVAELFNLSLSSIGRFIKRKRETGSFSPAKFGGYKRFALEPHADLVRRLVAERPDSTLAELQERLAKEKVTVSQTAIFRFLRHLKLTFKKKSSGLPSKTGRTLPRLARPCRRSSRALIRNGWSSSTKPVRTRKWPGNMVGLPKANGS